MIGIQHRQSRQDVCIVKAIEEEKGWKQAYIDRVVYQLWRKPSLLAFFSSFLTSCAFDENQKTTGEYYEEDTADSTGKAEVVGIKDTSELEQLYFKIRREIPTSIIS